MYGILQPGPELAEGVPYVRPSEIRNSAIALGDIRRTSAAIAAKYRRSTLQADDVLLSIVGTIGKVAVVPRELQGGNITQSTVRVRAKEGSADHRFLFWTLQSPAVVSQFNELRLGTGVPRLNVAHVRGLMVPRPPLPEQRRLADILDKADAIRRKRKEAIALTEELMRSAFLDMFGDPVTNPKGWKVKALGELADIVSGVTKGKKYDGLKTVEVPYMRVANVQDGHLVLDEVKTISVSEEEGQRYLLQVGDVLLTEGGDPDKLGRGTVWRNEVSGCIHQNHIFRVRSHGEARPEYLSAIIASERGKRYFLRAAKQTTGIATINSTQLKAFPVLLPPPELQDCYVAFLSSARTLRDRLTSASRGHEELFHTLMHRAFSGSLSS
jgi:type I restriction enzyme, S subunit